MEKKGRPTKYNAQFHPKLAEVLASKGLTDKEIALELSITEQTLNNWKKSHPEFFESLKRGKEHTDDQVENALLRNALGYEEEDTKVFQHEGQPVYAPFIKKHKPDTVSQIFWLKNRRPKEWRDKKEVELNAELPIKINVIGITDTSPE